MDEHAVNRARNGLRALRRSVAGALAIVLCGAALAACSTSGSAASKVLTIGTSYYIESLNPFVGIETQDDTAYTMIYPQLVQYGPGLKIEGDWAKSWQESADAKTITFALRDGAWSDGKPLTSDDAVWTIETILKYASASTSSMAQVLAGVSGAEAPDAHTLVVHYSRAIGAAIPNLEQLFILPRHVWEAHATGKGGSGLTDFAPEQHLPTVSGGPFTVTKYAQKGTTVFTPNPKFYGPKPHASAVALTYYTNPTAMIADLKAGRVAFVDSIPYKDADSLRSVAGVTLVRQDGNEVTNLGFNSSDSKKRNRELLDPTLREAFEQALPRQKIADTVFGGNAKPWGTILSGWSGGWLNPAVQPAAYDPAAANAILDTLGYRRGADGVRVVPATTGAHAQAAHRMAYSVIVPNDLDFDGHLQFTLIAQAFDAIGVQLTEVPGGDGSQSWDTITGPDAKYENADLFTWYWHPYIDPDYNLGSVATDQLGNDSDTGWSNAAYDAVYAAERATPDQTRRRALVRQAEGMIAAARPYIFIVQTDMITAHSTAWTGFEPNLWTLGKAYYTSPSPR